MLGLFVIAALALSQGVPDSNAVPTTLPPGVLPEWVPVPDTSSLISDAKSPGEPPPTAPTGPALTGPLTEPLAAMFYSLVGQRTTTAFDPLSPEYWTGVLLMMLPGFITCLLMLVASICTIVWVSVVMCFRGSKAAVERLRAKRDEDWGDSDPPKSGRTLKTVLAVSGVLAMLGSAGLGSFAAVVGLDNNPSITDGLVAALAGSLALGPSITAYKNDLDGALGDWTESISPILANVTDNLLGAKADAVTMQADVLKNDTKVTSESADVVILLAYGMPNNSMIPGWSGFMGQIDEMNQTVSESEQAVDEMMSMLQMQLDMMANMTAGFNESIGDMTGMITGLTAQMDSFTGMLSMLTDPIALFSGAILAYDTWRLVVFQGVYILSFMTLLCAIITLILRRPWPALLMMGFGFLSSGLLGVSSGLHAPVATLLLDLCAAKDELILNRLAGSGPDILGGCAAGQPITEVLGVGDFGIGDMMGGMLDSLTTMTNFSSFDFGDAHAKLDSIDNLTLSFNYTGMRADVQSSINATAAVVDAELVEFNVLTQPSNSYSLSNYTLFNATDYAAGQRPALLTQYWTLDATYNAHLARVAILWQLSLMENATIEVRIANNKTRHDLYVLDELLDRLGLEENDTCIANAQADIDEGLAQVIEVHGSCKFIPDLFNMIIESLCVTLAGGFAVLALTQIAGAWSQIPQIGTAAFSWNSLHSWRQSKAAAKLLEQNAAADDDFYEDGGDEAVVGGAGAAGVTAAAAATTTKGKRWGKNKVAPEETEMHIVSKAAWAGAIATGAGAAVRLNPDLQKEEKEGEEEEEEEAKKSSSESDDDGSEKSSKD